MIILHIVLIWLTSYLILFSSSSDPLPGTETRSSRSILPSLCYILPYSFVGLFFPLSCIFSCLANTQAVLASPVSFFLFPFFFFFTRLLLDFSAEYDELPSMKALNL